MGTKKSPHYRYIFKNKKVGAKKFTPTYRKILKISVPYSGFIFV